MYICVYVCIYIYIYIYRHTSSPNNKNGVYMTLWTTHNNALTYFWNSMACKFKEFKYVANDCGAGFLISGAQAADQERTATCNWKQGHSVALHVQSEATASERVYFSEAPFYHSMELVAEAS